MRVIMQTLKRVTGEFAKVLALLEKHGFADDTVLVYTADHGMFRGKFTVYNSGLRVPLMVRWPNRIAPGRSSTLVSLADILPTFVALWQRERFRAI